MQQKNFLLFFVLSFLLFIGWMETRRRLWPPPAKPVPQKDAEKPSPPRALQVALGPLASIALRKDVAKPSPPRALQVALGPLAGIALIPKPRPERPASKLLPLGSDEGQSPFHLQVLLDPWGASVRSVVLNKFQRTNLNDDLGEPVWKKDADGNFLRDEQGHKIPEPLELVPNAANRDNPSHLLFLFDTNNPTDARPLDTLGKRLWRVVPHGAEGKTREVREEEIEVDGQKRQRMSVSFATELSDLGLTVYKTYSLVEGDYHIGLEVKLALKDDPNRRDLTIRYQLTGAHGLPVEGKWYTNTFRNALIAEEENGQIWRDFQDLRQIASWAGGNEVKRTAKRMIRYAGVAVQFFASVIVVDEKQEQADNFIEHVRPTLETSVTRGVVKGIEENSLVLTTTDPRDKEQTFYLTNQTEVDPDVGPLRPNQRLAVVHYTDSKLRKIVVKVGREFAIQPLWVDDITVRVSTDPQKLAPGKTITHRYLLYNGPVKPSLLRQQKGIASVEEAVVNRYVNTLHLNTLTDYHSPGWLGSFSSAIYWTNLIIHCTNLMHWVLGGLYNLVPNYGICIILLTVMVRGLMFPLSRKQAMMGMKMQALAPEMKKLQEKYKDDKQALMQAQMEMYRKHKINPFGTCWLLLLQMPIFMGLYFAFQESINFRLASFWPTWIINLAAPDMLFVWGHNIPFISRPEDYGTMIYLGPCLNLLPVVAVALMMAQQKMMTPPPTDEQQEMQQKVMKYMMIFMGLMFYKVAAGLCVYFIASSLWGFAERRLLPKFNPQGSSGSTTVDVPTSSAAKAITNGPATSTDITRKARPGRSKKKERSGRSEATAGRGGSKDGAAEEESKSALGRFRNWIRRRRQRLRDWWIEVLKQAEKK